MWGKMYSYLCYLINKEGHLQLIRKAGGGLCSKIYLLCYAALLQKSTFYALQMPLVCSNSAQQESVRLCTNNIMWAALTPFGSAEQAGRFFRAPVCGGAFTLTFHFRVISKRVERSWLNKDVGEAVSCELLPGA